MPIKPGKDEKQDAWMARCVPEMMGKNGGTKRPNEQAVAACLTIWRDKDKGKSMRTKQCEPEPDEDQDDFMDRCMDEGYDEDECTVMWNNSDEGDGDDTKKANGEVVIKTAMHAPVGREFVLSDNTVDRVGDLVETSGWKLDTFQKNPIALFSHQKDFPIGRWHDIHITQDKQLRGRLELAPKGSSARIDELHALVDAGILRAVSVGFRPIKTAPLNAKSPYGGLRYIEHELVEASLVAVPANANALMTAKQLNVSAETIDLVFAGHGKERLIASRGGHGGHAITTKSLSGKTTNMTLSQRIADARTRITGLREKLAEHLATVDDANVTDEQMTITSDLNAKLAQVEKGLGHLVESERHIASATHTEHAAATAGGGDAVVQRTAGSALVADRANFAGATALTPVRPFNLPAKKTVEPIEYLIRAGTIQMYAHVHRMNMDEARKHIYGEDEATKAFFDWTQRAATAPAMTTVVGWAAELVQQVVTDFMQRLNPKSVFPRLAGAGLSLSFGRAGRIIIPTRSITPQIAGSFVGEGNPIPVRQGAFTSQTLTPKKMAVITTWTREIDEHSVPAIEGLLRQAVSDDTAIAIDSVLLDSNPATAVRPAGILNGVTPLTATAGGGFTALVGDIKQVTGALLTATLGNVRNPVWIMNPQQVMSAGLTPAPASGVFPFDTSTGRLQGWPIIDSGTVPLGTIIAVDAADFVAVGSEGPRFEISDQATLHLDDTTPLPISSPGTPATVAAPVRSLWQTDSLALRLILPMNWTMRRPGVVAAVTGVTW